MAVSARTSAAFADSKPHRLKGGTNDPHEQKRLAGRGIPCLGSPRLRSLLKKIGENVPFLFGSIGSREKNQNAAAREREKLSPSQARHKLLLLGFSDAGDEQDGQNPEQLINQDGQGAKLPESGTAGKESNQHKT